MSDAGTYSCIVKNVGGQVQHDAVITVAGMFVFFPRVTARQHVHNETHHALKQTDARALGDACVQNYCVCDSSRNICEISEIVLKLSKNVKNVFYHIIFVPDKRSSSHAAYFSF